MKLPVRFLVSATLVALATISHSASKDAQVDDLVEEWIDDYPGLAVAIARGDQFVFQKAWGFSDLDNEVPAAPSTLFNVYSVSKMFNGVALGVLAQDFQLDIDQPVTKLVPGLPDTFSNTSSRQLAGHTGGVGVYDSDDDWESFSSMSCDEPGDALSHFVHRPLIAAAGTEYHYSTYGQVMLSEVMGNVLPGTDYLALIQETVFDPSGMTRTRIDSSKLNGRQKSKAYKKSFWMFSEIDDINASCKFGAGGFVASAIDLARFGMAMYRGDLLDAETMQMVARPQLLPDGTDTGYGLGMFSGTTDVNGHDVRYLLHSGGSPGGRAYILILPDHQIAIGMAGNYDGKKMGDAAFLLAALYADLN